MACTQGCPEGEVPAFGVTVTVAPSFTSCHGDRLNKLEDGTRLVLEGSTRRPESGANTRWRDLTRDIGAVAVGMKEEASGPASS